MLRVAARFILTVAAIFLAACSTPAVCQSYHFDYAPDLFNHVSNLPYTAQVVEIWQDGDVRRETRAFLARDSQGRTRLETNSEDPHGSVVLFVPQQRQFIQLFPATKMAWVTTFPGTGPIPIHKPDPN